MASLDGKLLAVSLSSGGSEDGTLHFYDGSHRQGSRRHDRACAISDRGRERGLERRTGDGVYYTRFPRKGERPDADVNFYQQVYFHKLGTPESEDTYSIGKEFPAHRGDRARVIATMAGMSWPRSRTATAAILPITC